MMDRRADVFDVAEYILSKTRDIIFDEECEAPGDITNMKLQKLLYYCQGFSVVLLKRPLFDAAIEAWVHGPVIPSVYQRYKAYKAAPIPCTDPEAGSRLLPEEKSLIDDVYQVYGGFSAWYLRNMSHSEAPWKDAFNNGLNEITTEALASFFPSLVEND